MPTRRIALAGKNDYGPIVSVLSSSLASIGGQAPSWLLASLPKWIEDEQVYVSKEGNRVLAFACVESDLASFLYPKTRGYSHVGDILEAMNQPDGNVMALMGIYVDGALRHRGIGKELMNALFAHYKDYGWVTYSEIGEPIMTRFAKGRGFVILPGEHEIEREGLQNKPLWIKPLQPTGLCREGRW